MFVFTEGAVLTPYGMKRSETMVVRQTQNPEPESGFGFGLFTYDIKEQESQVDMYMNCRKHRKYR